MSDKTEETEKKPDPNPLASMETPDKVLEQEHIDALASPGDYQVERAWHRHFLNSNGQMLSAKDGKKTVKPEAMLDRVQRLIHTGVISKATASPV